MNNKSTNIPTILVILGATGDLMKKKIVPSIYHLQQHRRLPDKFRVVGMARRPLTAVAFRAQVQEDLTARIQGADNKSVPEFGALFHYYQGNFVDRPSWEGMKKLLEQIDAEWGVCTNKLFYLAVPPEHFAVIFKQMAAVGLNRPCGGERGWTRMLIEKPFGEDRRSAQKLFTLLNDFFADEQLYLIDHYLAKEIIQGIRHFRFSNNLFARAWDRNTIERIELRLLETIGAEGRGVFYDSVGAFRDVGQNHLLQMLAAITMDEPRAGSAAAIRARRGEILETLRPWSAVALKAGTARAQYEGYRNISGVKPDSTVETYCKVKTELLHPAWRGVPIILETGKRVHAAKKEVIVTLKHPARCSACAPGRHAHNRVVFSLAPEDRITIHFWTKAPGFEKRLEERAFNFFLYEHEAKLPYVEEYAELLFNCLIGEQSMFVSEREVEAQWRFTDPITRAWEKDTVPLLTYKPDTDEAIQATITLGQWAEVKELPKELAIIGLGKMGGGMARRMLEQGWRVVGYNRSPEAVNELVKEGLAPADTLEGLIKQLPKKKIIWLMVPAGKTVDEILFGASGLLTYLKPGDVVIDGGNSFYKDTIARAKKLRRRGVCLLDVGTSGGPAGARRGACLMIGGREEDFKAVESLFRDFALPDGYQFFSGSGAGHFVKMIHNGIEYGMMQALGEGFAILQKAKFNLDLTRVADIYNHGSVIESRLVGWLKDAFALYGEDLGSISGTIKHSGEGLWTVKTAREMKLAVKVIDEALRFRIHSEKHPSYTGQIVSSLRGQFGGHAVGKGKG